MIDEQIRQLADESAGRMLTAIAEAHLEGPLRIAHSRELAESLNEALGGACEGGIVSFSSGSCSDCNLDPVPSTK